MSLFLFKSFLAIIFLLAGVIAVICMFALMGKTKRKISDTFLRRMHKGMGFVFTILLLVISYFCINHVAQVGDQLSGRAVMHSVLSLGLIIVLVIKITIVQFYKQFLRFVPTMGIIVFSLAFVVFSTSAGYYFLRTLCVKDTTGETVTLSEAKFEGKLEKGALLFNDKCSGCHFSDKEENKIGPGLKNILKKTKLPSTGKPANIKNIWKQLKNPFLSMPAFPSLSEQELADLQAYLESL
ncbi:MAG: c-type cytochrome [Candidatus Aminicenantes bacterium]|nr:c-type cytochrome [Candidatus Aminicenantes bacterium]